MQAPDDSSNRGENARLIQRDAESSENAIVIREPHEELGYPVDPNEHSVQQQLFEDLRRNWRKTFVVICILVTECCERMTFYGVTGNLVILLRLFRMEHPSPSSVTLAFTGVCFLSPLFGGLVADAKLGRFNTIFGGALLYILGTAFLCSATHEYNSEDYLSGKATDILLLFALLLIALGTGGIKANVSPFGADQIRDEGSKKVERYFLWYYWSIQIGSVFAFTAIVYVQQSVSFFYGYVISACSMIVALAVFMLGRNSYITFPPLGSFLVNACKIVWSALAGLLCKCRTGEVQVTSCFDRAKKTFGGKFPDMQVEDVKMLLKIVPVFLSMIMYWIIYAQTQTAFLLQGTHMDLGLTNNVSVPVASLGVFESLAVIVLIPVMGKLVFPLLPTATPLKKMCAGMLLAAASVAVAGVVEIERKKSLHEHGTFEQQLFRSSTNASHMSIFYQTPQFVLLGAGEVLVAITGLEFAYMESPRYVHGVVIGVYLATIGAGFFLASALVAVVSNLSDWYPEDVNQGSLENYFFLLAGLMVANFMVFVAVSVRYRYLSYPNPAPRHFSFSGRRNR